MKFTKKNGGFTLVELIVVIAILAILAAIAVPAYSGYISKANEAADQQLLGAVNTAFAAACLENNEDMLTISGYPSIPLTGAVGSKTIDFDNVAPAEYKDAFKVYFGSNTASKFKTFTSIAFDSAKGVFVDGATESITVKYGNSYVNISGKDVQSLASSTYGEIIGGTQLLNKVGEIADFASVMDSDTYDKVIGDASFQREFLGIFGSTDGMSDADVKASFDGSIEALAKQKLEEQYGVGNIPNDPALVTKTQNEIKANMAVLYAAQNSNSSWKDTSKLLSEAGAKDKILATMNSDPGTGLAQAANAYGMYYAYAHSTGNAALVEGKTPVEILTSFENDANFRTWMTGDQAEADYNAYMSAMSMIDSSVSGNTDAALDVLMNGYSYDSTTNSGNKELHDLIAGLIG